MVLDLQAVSDLASTAKIIRTSSNSPIIFVEGGEDKRFLAPHLRHGGVEFIVSRGRDNVLASVVRSHQHGIVGVLGVVDSDFDYYTSANHDANVIVTQVHDVEALLVTSPALHKMLSENCDVFDLGRFESSCGRKVGEWACNNAQLMGLLRLYSDQHGCRFPDLNICRYLDTDIWRVKTAELIGDFAKKCGITSVTESDILEFVSQAERKEFPPGCVASGDDLIKLIRHIVTKAIGNQHARNMTEFHIRKEIRLCYSATDFHSSPIAEGMRNWQARNPGFKLLD